LSLVPETLTMITVVSDTHGEESHRLEGRTRGAVRDAEVVLHAGDLTTPRVREAFVEENPAFHAVRGNNDGGITDLPTERVVEHGDLRIAMVHGHRHSRTGLTMLAREREADLAVVGHSHRPGFDASSAVPLLNPGSHAHPRYHRPAHAELRVAGDALEGELRQPDGSTLETFRVGID
jgi:putative phosphoesterase